jgi:hypothetical protein
LARGYTNKEELTERVESFITKESLINMVYSLCLA